MKISDVGISSRKQVLQLSNDDLKTIASYQDLIVENIDVIVEEFYETQTSDDEIALLIGDADTLQRLISAQRKYVLDLFSGEYEATYVNNRLRIGLIHKRIGVEPKLYLSAVRILKTIICDTLERNEKSPEKLKKVLLALEKLIYFDTTLVFDAYIDSLVGEIESAKRKTEKYASDLEKKVADRTQQLEEQAKLEPLTGLYNQRVMRDMLSREITLSRRRQQAFSFVYFDIDKFKNINDTLGHVRGDEVLKSVAESMKSAIRETDIPCRYGGDEFCMILIDCTSSKAEKICEKLIDVFSAETKDISLSFGIVEIAPDALMSEDNIIEKADEKMYKAKEVDGFKICL